MITIATEGKDIKSWCVEIDDGALRQAKNLARLPFIYSHVALMPDAHVGYGMPIGGVIACENVVIPNAVGVDVGCGVLAVRTSLMGIDRESLKNIVSTVYRNVPVGFKHRSVPQVIPEPGKNMPVCEREYQSARFQLGTLGGGNHFIEVQKGSDGYIWYMIHSGSRNLGKQVAEYYNKLAKSRTLAIPKEWDLAYFTADEPEFAQYIGEMTYCMNFAQANRDRMSEEVRNAFIEAAGGVNFDNPINIHHNYAASEEHFGKKLWVHRKGATSSKDGQMGIIPGSQGTKSYIVKGKGNPLSFMSSSHGAGRVMGRNEAIKKLNLEKERKILEDQGILHALKNRNGLEEASGAYKDISIVMKEQEDLVSVVAELTPMAVIKG